MDVDARLDSVARIKNIAIVHGDKDRSVPISQSYRIKEELTKRGANVTLFIRQDTEHFWELPDGSANQYDFPPLFDALRASSHRGSGRIWDFTRVYPTWSDAMGKRIIAVYGTHGTPDQIQSAKERAYEEASIARIYFRVDCEIVPDTIDLPSLKGRNVFLFGTPTTNALWKYHPTAQRLLDRARQKHLDVTAWLIQGRKGKDIWSAMGGYDSANSNLAYYLKPWFSNEMPFPEWILMNRSVLDNGFSGVMAAGFNGGPEAWRKQ